MCQPSRHLQSFLRASVISAACVIAVPVLGVQDAEEQTAAEDAIEAYLDRLELDHLLAEQIRRRLERAQGSERLGLAERLAEVYVRLLRESETAEQRTHWEERSRSLLAEVPDANSLELRLDLAVAVYRAAEDVLERQRLRLADADEAPAATESLRSVRRELLSVATEVNQQVQSLERREERGDESEELLELLAEGRRLRSLAFYYAGWTDYYVAFATSDKRLATSALTHFGWLLNSRGDPANLERLRGHESLLKYDHVARAAIGCGMCASVRGNDVEAVRWLDAVEEYNESEEVQSQILLRRISVLARAKRWSDLELLVRKYRYARYLDSEESRPLPVNAARLLAVRVLEAEKRHAGRLLERLAVVAFADLVKQAETAHVLDLVERFGSAPLGDEGFITHYVRGIHEYEQARATHEASDVPADEPTANALVTRGYESAAILLDAAMNEDDASQFTDERAGASRLLGFCFYYSSVFSSAADWFVTSSELASEVKAASEALWLAVVALDRAARDGDRDAAERRDQLAAFFLQTYPQTDRAARLLLTPYGEGLADDGKAVEVLLAVAPSSARYIEARQHAARLLYRLFRSARGADRDFFALRFADVTDELIQVDRENARGTDAEALQAANNAVGRCRQLLEAILSLSTPDTDRAESTLEMLDAIVLRNRMQLEPDVESELIFRRLQIATARGETASVATLMNELEDREGNFVEAAHRLVYTHELSTWDPETSPPDTTRRLIAAALRVVDTMAPRESSVRRPSGVSVVSNIALAAGTLWKRGEDRDMLDLALEMDALILSAYPNAEASLARSARFAEDAGQPERALDAWKKLLSGRQPASDGWFEARYESIRLTARTDPTRARVLLDQHKLLYPRFGSPPWDERLKELDNRLPPAPATDGVQGDDP